ncbi:hypothetical protein K491DRAFT_237965 [Lophiostoma macrostomum CBS 122681]|uniref:B30.2/SPRY domain-containing protein n=1 Tax=Lophiostoma macrostomum CBS 122681 TaxID=1314788 RepID=A0A6A6TJ50_9PLEO|nr:hypothetical protein K491DRAFT_237965 [Lophiostoma macrostomum CBS 122681]
MVPLENGVYYFEIEIEHETECFQDIGMRFCEEHVSLDGMLGCGEKSWGYHGYAGHIHACGQTERSSFSPRFGHGDTVGCGVNFHQGIAFYTLNGDVIGKAFQGIKGKLYPAISAHLMHDGGVLTAKFWSENEHQNKTFVYKGSLSDPRTLEEPKTPLESFEASKNRGAKEDEDDS